jgi:hypothetical protein
MRVTHDAVAKSISRVLRNVVPGLAVVRHTAIPKTTIRPSPDEYHLAQGWAYDNYTWRGQYRVPGLECPGEIWQHYSKFCARIANPPDAVLNGSHSACFAADAEKPGWYRIHFANMPRTVDGAILAVEQTLQEGT